ncbi:MAG: flp pilus-assembly TadE/G-like family protein [Actinomycetota bacterium]|nr:flp pilus-assembly TadE/G-like family protein [Actinomycetota bacterium]
MALTGPDPTARHDDGFATVWGITWVVVILSIGWVCLLAAFAVARQHHVDGAADLVALSAAARVQDGGNGCEAAAQLAASNRVTLLACDLDGDDVVVEVSTVLRLPLGIEGRLVSRARAGPSP